MGGTTLSEQEKSQVDFVHGSSCNVISTTVARLYDGKSGRFEYTGIVGAVSVVSNRLEKTHYIKIVDLRNTVKVFEQELYDGFDYQKQRDFFHTFEGDSQVFGLSFADVTEAAEFYACILNAKSGSKPVNNVTSTSKTSQANTSSTNLKPEKKKSKGGFMSKLFGSSSEQELEISAPTGFQHKSHIGWDPEKGFDIRDIPADWRKLFQSAGIKKSELKDVATAQYIVTVIGEQMASGATPSLPNAQPTRSQPPPPPTTRSQPPPPPTKSNAPPPPPPTKNTGPPPPPPPHTTGGGPPPPPPPPITTGGGPPPPPPPPIGGGPPPPPPPSVSFSGGGGGGGGRFDLLASIREGKSLKSVEENPLPDLKEMSVEGNRSLVDTLAAAMANRRGNMREDEDDGDDDDDDWSDY